MSIQRNNLGRLSWKRSHAYNTLVYERGSSNVNQKELNSTLNFGLKQTDPLSNSM